MTIAISDTGRAPAMSLAPCRPAYSTAIALYIVKTPTPHGQRWALQRERVYVRDGVWMVRRDRKLVPLADQPERPVALDIPKHGIFGGVSRWWDDIDSFCRDNGLDPVKPDVGWR